ncbi:VOC family protein [Cupriavidus basilensis]|uniref:VOC family protein n=1 Tax=Cupriavidus basilensis TaxID=68895 RepID=UPI00157B0E13|nr:VOC family protein [Cupriavidus basilensis]NUA30017.1 biphenyl 2,3-dioxygenase [Cupriavidus basilensis]
MSDSMDQFPIPCPDPEARAPQKLAHIVLTTRRFDETIHWWSVVLGARVMYRNALLCFLSYDDEHHRLALINAANFEPKRRESTGLDHVAFTFGSLGDLLHTYERLKGHGLRPQWCINHGPTTSLYYRDPDGIQAELQVDNFAAPEELEAWFRSGAFAENAIGVEFDPEHLLERYQAGEPAALLMRSGEVTSRQFLTLR